MSGNTASIYYIKQNVLAMPPWLINFYRSLSVLIPSYDDKMVIAVLLCVCQTCSKQQPNQPQITHHYSKTQET